MSGSEASYESSSSSSSSSSLATPLSETFSAPRMEIAAVRTSELVTWMVQGGRFGQSVRSRVVGMSAGERSTAEEVAPSLMCCVRTEPVSVRFCRTMGIRRERVDSNSAMASLELRSCKKPRLRWLEGQLSSCI